MTIPALPGSPFNHRQIPERNRSMLILRNLLAAALMLLSIGAGAASAGQISSLVVFGDSLSDVGDAYLGTGGAIPPSPPYFAGRFSNGPIWIDHLAAGLGLTSPTPFLAGGQNFAFGSADSGTGFNVSGAPNLLTQVFLYGQTLSGGPADPNSLYVIWAGSNDYLNGQTNPLIPSSNVASAVGALASLGATQFMVLNLPPLGMIPQSIANPNPIVAPTLDALSVAHNTLLAQQLTALDAALPITIYQPNIFDLYRSIQADPAAYGFTNITTGALLDGNLAATGYMFWDAEHPTAAAHALIGERALEAVPEPSTLALATVGLVLCAGCTGFGAKRKR